MDACPIRASAGPGRTVDRLDYITDLVDRLDLFRQIEQYLSLPLPPGNSILFGPRAWARARPLAAIAGLVRPQADHSIVRGAGAPDQLGLGRARHSGVT